MPNSGLSGPYSLTKESIDRNVTRTSAGAYALGRTIDGVFHVHYVGRSDGDVRGRLKDHVGKYTQFKFDYFSSAKAAFEKECRLYHDFGPPANSVHPARPRGSGWKCPACAIFD